MTSVRPIRVLGVGNVLMGDDGFGPYVTRILEARYHFPEEVEVLDVGTPGLDFTPYLQDARAVIVVDTVSGDASPGTLRTYDREQLLAKPPPARTNPHQPGLREALMATDLTDTSPQRLLVIGVIPERTDTGTGLSPAVRAAVEPTVAAVLEELGRFDLTPRPREQPLEPDIWWEGQ